MQSSQDILWSLFVACGRVLGPRRTASVHSGSAAAAASELPELGELHMAHTQAHLACIVHHQLLGSRITMAEVAVDSRLSSADAVSVAGLSSYST